MRGRIFCLLLVLLLGFGGIASAETNPPLQLAAPAIPGSHGIRPSLAVIPDSQQGQSAPLTQGQPQGGVTLHDIRGPVELPDSSGLLFWLVIGLTLLVIAGLLLYFWKRRKKGEKPPTPQDVALTALARLRTMMNPEEALSYAAQLSEILRRYVEARFQIHSTRQTTREFFADLSLNPQAVRSMAAHHDRLKECLEQCDMAKFAHCIPDQPEMEAMEGAVRSFIRASARTMDEEGER
jgi:LPXTG-motif cell wall-anchored protein